MQKDAKKANDCQREMEITISEKEVDEEYQKTLHQFAIKAKIRGFRKGKAPLNLVKQMYQDELKSSVINNLAPKAINEALLKENVSPVSPPVIMDLDYQEGKPVKLKVSYEVFPIFELPEYKKIKVKNPRNIVSQKDMDKYLQDLRERSAKYTPVQNRGIQNDDYLLVQIKGMDLDSKKMLPTEKTIVLAGHSDNEKSLNEVLLGMKEGEQKDFNINYKRDHKNKRLAGKNIRYTVKVLSIKEKVLPELNDDFAKDLGEFKDLDSLKKQIKKELKSAKENHSKQSISEEIIKKISNNVDFDLPESVVKQETKENIKRILSSLPKGQQNLDKEQMNKINKEAREKARNSIKSHLILKKIAEKEKIDISKDELEIEYKSMANKNNIPLERIRGYMNQEGREDNLKQNMLLRKTIDFLVDNAKIEE
jgi:trigger factor